MTNFHISENNLMSYWIALAISYSGCALVIARRGETTHSGVDVNNTHLSMINTLIPAWISNYIHYKMWDEITYPFLNFNGCTIEV